MRWRQGRRSANVEDRRGQSGGGGRRRGTGIKLGIGGIVLVAAVGLFMGKDLGGILELVSDVQGGGSAGAPAQQTAPAGSQDDASEFVRVVLADTEDTWNPIFQQMGRQYEEPTLVLFSGSVASACGNATAAVGPFYCPGDRQVYIDLAFFGDLSRRFGAPGDFAQAYVIAHEVGHHIQTLTGVSQQVRDQKRGLSEEAGNQLSVRQELQADCYAGVWAYHANRVRNIVEQGDVEEALNAATQIGDDRMQQRARGHVTPETWTHGSSAQRVRWFRVGLQSGNMNSCDTFNNQ